MKIDQKTLFNINTLHPSIRKEVKSIYLNKILSLLPKNRTCRFTTTFRSFEEQQKLYAQGRTTPGKKVTNALPGQSFHQYGLAIDFVILEDKDGDGKFETASWKVDDDWISIAREFKAHGYSWGGDWKFKDYPHVEKTFGYTWKQLKELYESKKIDAEGYVIL